MKILISADMEGATGVTWPADCEPGAPEWQRCRSMFTSDVNAAIAGMFDGGATEVLVNEAHATMRNLVLEDLDQRATGLAGRHAPVEGGPVTVEVDATQLVTNACMVPTVERVSERRVRFVAPSAYEMIRCFKAVCTLISAATEERYG